MSTLSLLFLSGCITLLFAVQGSSAIQCYSCTVTGGCQDDFDRNAAGVSIVDCDKSCWKTKKDDQVFMRGCTPTLIAMTVGENECEEKDDAYACVCTGNLCNGSTKVTTSVSVLAALTLVIGLLTRM